jgi:carbamate kinase
MDSLVGFEGFRGQADPSNLVLLAAGGVWAEVQATHSWRSASLRVVVGLGGNALLERGEPLTHEAQRRHVMRAALSLAAVGRDHQLVVTHGNGPQVGLLALQDRAMPEAGDFPLDVLGAETEGMIGYMLAQEIGNELPGSRVVSILTQVEVDREDPAFARPSKPVGPSYGRRQAEGLAKATGWSMAPDGDGFRRVVPSPEPLRILEIETLRLLVEAGTVVICAGGGGIPVVFDPWGRAHGVEAVVDKDHSAALVAEQLEADALILLTDVSAVFSGWGTPESRPLHEVTAEEVAGLDLPAGSMGPKAEAAARFVERTGGFAAIGALEDAAAVLRGQAGTRVRK